jgi:GrpB-like predicted nucleotidyltransferase (UPF0157 family)/GNAT superfamily N-acetyltransferase
MISLEPIGRDDPEALRLYADFIREADDPLQIEVDVEAEIAAGPPPDLTPPDGVLFLVRVDGEPAGLGGVRHLDTEVAEIKSMFVVPARRGRGVGRRIIAELEGVARERGCRATRLDTSEYLTPAVALYRAAGYVEVPDYNGNPKADLWFERRLADEPIRLAPHDPAWATAFERERAALEDSIGAWATGGIHHIGSTAVAGLAAKPIVDILVGVEDLEASRACFEPLARLEYRYAPYRAEEMHWFCKPDPGRRTHHLHLAPAGGRRYAEELAFRDRLRADPEAARAYADLKRDLAARFEDDRESYTEAKAEFIQGVLRGPPPGSSPAG